ncbi:MAG TPA: hypothetical protein VK754_00565 [Propionibacteriaceae bacterium]|nr:hypothetical protein [Propionibacteriaceae bacterium]
MTQTTAAKRGRILLVLLALLAALAILAVAPPAQAAPNSYQVCNSGNSVGYVQAYNIFYPYEVRIVSPGSSNCKFMTGYTDGIRIDPEYACASGGSCQVQRWRIRPGSSDTYGPWHCGEQHFDPPDAWVSQGGIDIQTSNSDGTTC